MYQASQTRSTGEVGGPVSLWEDVPSFRVRTRLVDGSVVWFSRTLQHRTRAGKVEYREREETAEEFWSKQW